MTATYAINFSGLRPRPTYDSLLRDIAYQPMIRYPDRRATQLRNSPYLTQLDGVNQAEIAAQQARMQNEQLKKAIIAGIATGQVGTQTDGGGDPATQVLVEGHQRNPQSL